ncbi:hypothetical protein BJ684DRAFT_18793 [Piptocephalis cylindrospora]|uniref:Peptide hydrolase n=1 Tax=Piptocephalis cylindrospora TaxID=1907219 RepID=A0A4P9Y6T3_9FUNG|nr:hypothetical protein BJ684DRAFT_18793 [Piptocephalis cylindrospora]|eukprot:RKP14826.1 hypothetical protein BJ684DRAFT_18793 [Piptocephalis cylindrospora]
MSAESTPLIQPSRPAPNRPLNAARDLLRRNHSLFSGVTSQLERSGLGAEDSPRRNRCSQLTLSVMGISVVVLIAFYLLRPTNEPFAKRKMYDRALDVEDIFDHLRAFSSLASKHNGTRAVGPGYNASADYLIGRLGSYAPCKPTTQTFTVPIWTQDNPASLSTHGLVDVILQEGRDFTQLRYGGGNGLVNVQGARVSPVHGHPCHLSSYNGSRDSLTLIPYPLPANCSVWEAAHHAETSKASGIIFHLTKPRSGRLPNPRARLTQWRQGDPLLGIPALMTSHSTGQLLASGSLLRINLSTSSSYTLATTSNVLCLWPGKKSSSDAQVLVVGSHLDSVPAGPGLVDNASGASSTLSILLSLHRSGFQPSSSLLFAWWGAEELGLLGSRAFVHALSQGESLAGVSRNNIVGALNFDMLASPNGIPLIHNGESAPAGLTTGSRVIQEEFEMYFEQANIPYELEPMWGGSDFLPFLLDGIPAGGILTGAGEVKSPEERREHGGLARTPRDPCYHRDCDTLDNVNRPLLDLTSHAAQWAIVGLAAQPGLRDRLEMAG